ncbi:Alpha/Beta hydrolase protein [Mycena albidolilacea]|uniref:Alpha/Beta hydrolase protein n=1 Tax=Mycena albidolilacea TaxID=1033008 RepID=A0AAD6Z1G7_9AGAR|nr:Alpha/Beta hydrolase protein [Mycena albidolilacea]
MTELPFNISVSSEQLDALKQRLALTRFPDELDDAGWAYGAPLADIKRLVTRWQDGYDWRKHEALLNAELPQFTRDIAVDGFGTLNVHYVHKRSALKTAIPLLFVHGWPGSFIEARKITPLLTVVQPDRPSFHVVALSLPGYGFSEAPTKKGFQLAQYAEVCNKLMISLGYDEYVTQGGDWGSMITRKIATVYGGKHSKAWHTNFPLVSGPEFSLNPIRLLSSVLMIFQLLWLSPAEKAGLQRAQEVQNTGLGYLRLQSTKPQTIGYSVSDSPAGLLAWIYEKLVAWTDKYPWDDDEILTWISIYWFSRAGPAATQRIYYEVASENAIIPSVHGVSPTIPLGLSFFPGELVNLPRSWVRRTGNVVFEGEHPMGGHFAAHETPELLVADLRKMFGRGGPAYGVVPGRVGY